MKVIKLANAGKLIIAVICLSLLSLGCEDNKRVRRTGYLNQYGTYGARGTNPTYTNDYFSSTYQGSNYGSRNYAGTAGARGMGDPRGGYSGSANVPGELGYDPRNPNNGGGVLNAPGIPGRNNLPGGGNMRMNGTASTVKFPYVIFPYKDAWFEQWTVGEGDGKRLFDCSDGADRDQDGICDLFEIHFGKLNALHPATFNGFKVGGIAYDPDSNILEKVYDDYRSNRGKNEKIVRPEDVLLALFADSALRLQTEAGISGSERVGVISGGFTQQPTNWGTEIKDQFKRKNARLPYQEQIGYGDMDVAEKFNYGNALLEKSDHITVGDFAGFGSNIGVKDHYLVCTEAYFRKPANSPATSFRIMNAGEKADDGVFILDNGVLVAYSLKTNLSNFFKNAFANLFNKGLKNDLEHVIRDKRFHLMDFCFLNEKKDKGQGEVRYWRFAGDMDWGYEPLNPRDFRVTAPEGYNGSLANELLPLDSDDYIFKPAPADCSDCRDYSSGSDGSQSGGSVDQGGDEGISNDLSLAELKKAMKEKKNLLAKYERHVKKLMDLINKGYMEMGIDKEVSLNSDPKDDDLMTAIAEVSDKLKKYQIDTPSDNTADLAEEILNVTSLEGKLKDLDNKIKDLKQ